MRVSRRYSKGQFKHRSGVYRNYRGEVVFTFVKPKNEPITTRERVWHNIGKNYNSLYFVILSESSDRDERLSIEDKYARDNGALYWNPSPKQKKL